MKPKSELPMSYLLEDDWTLEEFYADICTEEQPCPWCLKSKEKKNARTVSDAISSDVALPPGAGDRTLQADEGGNLQP